MAFAILPLLYVAMASWGGDGPFWIAAMSLVYLVFPASAAVATYVTSLSVEPHTRIFWRLMAAGMALMTAGEVWWAIWQVAVDPAGPPGIGVSDLFFIPAYLALLAAAAFLLWNRFGALTVLGRMKQTIDGLMLTTVALSLVTLVLPGLLSEVAPQPGIYTVYALLDLVILIALVLATMIPSGLGRPWWETFVAGGMALFAVGDLAFNHLPAFGSYMVGDTGSALVDLLWISGYALIGAGAIRFRGHRRTPAAATFRTRARSTEFAPLLIAMAAVPAFMWEARFRAASEASYWIWMTAAALLGMLVVARVAVIAADNRELASRSITDPLTGVTNHRFFHEQLGVEIERARRTGEPLTLAIVDLDELRAVNNTRGHLAGDRRIRLVSAAIAETIRTTDTVSRVGGDEFAVILPGTGLLDAYAVVDRIADEIIARQAGQTVRTTVSVGMASFPEHGSDKEELTARAAEALASAKDGGRNRTVTYEPGTGARTTEERIRAVEAESLLRTVRALAAAVDARDAYTHSHSRSVAKLAVALGRRLGLSSGHIDLLKIAALLHDVGKIGTPDHVLRKPGELNDEEYKIVMGHPELGERILASAVSPEILPWVVCHHERWDGGGYPRGIAGVEIPEEARIIAVCDTFDAMTSDRPYRDALPVSRAIAEVEAFAGRQFDPRIAAAFVAMMREVATEA